MSETSASAVNDNLSAMLTNMTIVQLKKELKKQSLKTTGAKNELILRLEKVMQVERARSELQLSNNGEDDDARILRNVRRTMTKVMELQATTMAMTTRN